MSTKNGRRLYAAVHYPDGVRPRVLDVSHSVKALHRRNPFAPVFPVICTGYYPNASSGAYSTYERLSKEPIMRGAA